MLSLVKPVAVLGMLAMYALSSLVGVKPGVNADAVTGFKLMEQSQAEQTQTEQQVLFYETDQAIVFQMADNKGSAQVTVNKDGKKGKIKIDPKKSFKVTYKRGEFDLEVTGEMDDAQRAYTEEVVRTLLKYTDERSFVKRVGLVVRDRVAGYLKRVRGKLAAD